MPLVRQFEQLWNSASAPPDVFSFLRQQNHTDADQWLMQQADAKSKDAAFGAHWYDSVSLCRWLSQQSGLAESDQSYADPNSLDEKQYPREPDPGIDSAPRDWPLEPGRRGFRLPTESEWEVACRAGLRTAYGFGSDDSLLDRFSWFVDNSGKRVHPPREHRPGFRGLFDMHGNLFEWTHSWSDDQMAGEGPRLTRASRGGSWYHPAMECRAAYRNGIGPTSRTIASGIRLALSVPSAQSPEADK